MNERGLKLLAIDTQKEADRICAKMRDSIALKLRRKGAIVAISGGIDSSVTAALAVRALGKDRVIGLMMPERDSSPETAGLSRQLAESLGIRTEFEDISEILRSVGCYKRQDEAYKATIPEYGEGWKSKIVLPPVTSTDELRYFSLVALSPDGMQQKKRLGLNEYLQIVAATNFKQRVRKMLEYYHADKNNYAVCGTPNRLEYDQGFFVKLGDGAADVKPIAHLYKTQVYAMAEYLGVPEVIRSRPPTTDTYSLPQSQEEFYFSLPYDQMDVCLFGINTNMPAAEIGDILGLTEEQVERVYADIRQKRRTSEYLHAAPVLMDTV
ncbi:MAG: NAD(+) synthase [Spirochaetales bacterium]|nr:NAD(+) synthase [Spirochaetales bacterium]